MVSYLSTIVTLGFWLSLDPAGLPSLPSQSEAASAAADASLALDDIQGDIMWENFLSISQYVSHIHLN